MWIRLNRVALLATAAMFLGSGVAWGAPQTTEQQKCINKVNKSGNKLHEAQGADHRACVKDFGKGTLTTSGEVCLTADRKGKIAKREAKVTDFESKFCVGAGIPNFGYTSGTSVIMVTEQAEIDLMHDLFGNPVDGGLFVCDPNTNQCLCQRNMINRIEKLMAKMPRVFGKCKKAALKLNDDPYPTGAASAAELQTCLDDAGISQSVAADTGGQIAEVVALLGTTLTDQCEDTGVTGVSFPGVCNGLTGNTARDCIVRLVRCRTCLMINAMDGLSANCDTFDNAAADATCPPP